MTTFNINSLTLSQKRDLVKELRAAIKSDSIMLKQYKVNQKAEKEAAKKAKVMEQIKAAELKLARLTAKLSV